MKTLIKGGRIYDGSASEPFLGDILIEDGRIVNIGRVLF